MFSRLLWADLFPDTLQYNQHETSHMIYALYDLVRAPTHLCVQSICIYTYLYEASVFSYLRCTDIFYKTLLALSSFRIGSRDKDSTQELGSHVAGPFVQWWSSAALMQLAFKPHHEGAPVGIWKIRRSLPHLAGGATSFKLVVSWPCWRHWCRWFDCVLVHILTLWADQKYYDVKAILKQPFLPLGGTGCSRMFKVHVSQTLEARPGH